MSDKYLVVFEKVAADNWGAFAPDLSGAVGAGDSLDSARLSVLEGIGFQLADIAERGESLPLAKTTSVDFAEFDTERTQTQYVIEWLSVEVPAAVNYLQEAHQAA